MEIISRIVAASLLLLVSVLSYSPQALAQEGMGPRNWQVMAGAGALRNEVISAKFYPQTITIDVGDSVTWTAQGDAHTVTFLSGNPAPSPLSPEAITPAGGNTYDGTGFVNSGIIEPGKSFTLTFTKEGAFDYLCLFHPGMSGKVVVQSAGTAYPQTQSQINRQFRIQRIADINAGINVLNNVPQLSAITNSDGSKTYPVSAGAGNGTQSIMRFLPDPVVLNEGDSITWTNQDPMMPHTVTFPGPSGEVIELPDPAALQPAGGSTFDGSTLTSSGVLTPLDTPGNHIYTLKFTKSGTFDYECLFHDEIGMVGKVIVLRKT